MGEKIKDLGKVQIGNSEFMIELNEGYTHEQGRVIHIQNHNFRYLLKEKTFLHFAAEILRSNEELRYIKSHPALKKDDGRHIGYISRKMSDIFRMFADILNENSIDYRFIEETEKHSVFIINPLYSKQFKNLMKRHKEIKELEHPYGKLFGYSFLYMMKKFGLYKFNDSYIEIYYQLPSMSFTPDTWIPLDNAIQKRIWENKDTAMDGICYIIYRLSWAIFKDGFFSQKTIQVLNEELKEADFDLLKEYLLPVFFSYSDTMVSLLKERKYNDIIESYLTFIGY